MSKLVKIEYKNSLVAVVNDETDTEELQRCIVESNNEGDDAFDVEILDVKEVTSDTVLAHGWRSYSCPYGLNPGELTIEQIMQHKQSVLPNDAVVITMPDGKKYKMIEIKE